MADFPSPSTPNPPILTPFHPDSIGDSFSSSSANAYLEVAASLVWPVADRAFFYPFTLLQQAVVYQLLFFVGAASSGNLDVGVYDIQGNRIVSAGSTAMSATTNTVQELNVADTVLPAGNYLLAAAVDNTTGTCMRQSANDEILLCSIPIYEQGGLTAAALPSTATPALATGGAVYVWVVGIQLRSVF